MTVCMYINYKASINLHWLPNFAKLFGYKVSAVVKASLGLRSEMGHYSLKKKSRLIAIIHCL